MDIKRLIPMQEDRLSYYRDRWLRVGLNTNQATDRQLAEGWIRNAYRVARLEPPRMIVWVDSPMGCLVAYSLLNESVRRAQVGDLIRKQFGDEIWARVRPRAGWLVGTRIWDQVWDRTEDPARAFVLALAWAQAGEPIQEQVWAQIGGQIRPQVEAQVRAQVGTRVGTRIGDRVSGQIGHNVLNWVENRVGDQVGSEAWNQVRPGVWDPLSFQVGDQVRNQVRDQIRDQLRAQVRDSVEVQIGDRVCARVGARIWAQVADQVLNGIREGVEAEAGGQISDFCFGQHEADRLGVYEFFLQECGLRVCEKLLPFMPIAEHCGWWLPYREVAIVSERPVELHLNTDGQLHRDGGPAVVYGDGWGVWALNGVRVSQYRAETAGDRLDPNLVLGEQNAEIRREFVRKVGVERLCESLGARVVDAGGNYELLELDLHDGRRRPYLKMKNPSIGVYHIEGVPPSCRSVREALVWRNGTNEWPVVLT